MAKFVSREQEAARRFPPLAPDKQRLVEEALRGAEKHFNQACRKYGLPRATRSRIRHEFISDFGLKIYRIAADHRKEGKGKKASWEGYLATCLDHLIIDVLRKQTRAKREMPFSQTIFEKLESDRTMEALLESRVPEAEDFKTRLARAQALHEAIEKLRPPHKRIVELQLNGLRYDEIAQALGKKVGTIKSGLHAAKKELKKRLAGDPRLLV